MALYSNLKFFTSVLSIASLFCIDGINSNSGEYWTSISAQSNYQLISIPDSMSLDESLVSEETNATTVISCAMYCRNNERESLYYNYNTTICYCNTDLDTRFSPLFVSYEVESHILYGYVTSSLRVTTNTTTFKYDIQPYNEDCWTLYHLGYTTNAIYTVQPTGESVQDTYCDMDVLLDVGADDCLQWLQAGYTDDGVYNIRLLNGTTVRVWCDQTSGGWTLIQRRTSDHEDFYRTWTEYVNGFGEASGDYWLGLEAIRLLTRRDSSLRIYMTTHGDLNQLPSTAFAKYGDFRLASASDKYRLYVGGFVGDCGDGMAYHNEQQFTTKDSDNDPHPDVNCAVRDKGAWWYNGCYASNLNGLYIGGQYSCTSSVNCMGMTWIPCWGEQYSLQSSSMAIQRH